MAILTYCRTPITVLLSLLGLSLASAHGATGQLELTVVDKDTGKPVACRMHLAGPNSNKPRRADKVPFWHDHFVLPGKMLLKLPLGNYTFVHRTRPGISRPERAFYHQGFRRRFKAGRIAALRRHVGRRLVVGRFGRAPAGRRHRIAHVGRRSARGRSRHLAHN